MTTSRNALNWGIASALSLATVATLAVTTLPTTGAHAAGAQDLTSRQQAGQRVIYSYPGLTPPQSLLDRIRAGEAAGVIFFKENVSSQSQVKSVIETMVKAQRESPVAAPLLLMTDQEGGQVRRLPGAPVESARQVGDSADPAATATRTGKEAGDNLRSAGMNLNLAPVIDVYRKDGDFLDRFGRSYSKDPAQVAKLGAAFITAQQQTGVAASAKHFPGLGTATTNQNTDEQKVTLNVPLTTLRDVDEKPYAAAIQAGTKLVMTSWAIYPALDAKNPAGLSSTVVRKELRERLGFTGVTITDALEAKSLASYGATGPRGVAAATAGMDLILCSAREVAQGDQAATALADALDSGQLDKAEFGAAVKRATDLRTSLPS